MVRKHRNLNKDSDAYFTEPASIPKLIPVGLFLLSTLTRHAETWSHTSVQIEREYPPIVCSFFFFSFLLTFYLLYPAFWTFITGPV